MSGLVSSLCGYLYQQLKDVEYETVATPVFTNIGALDEIIIVNTLTGVYENNGSIEVDIGEVYETILIKFFNIVTNNAYLEKYLESLHDNPSIETVETLTKLINNVTVISDRRIGNQIKLVSDSALGENVELLERYLAWSTSRALYEIQVSELEKLKAYIVIDTALARQTDGWRAYAREYVHTQDDKLAGSVDFEKSSFITFSIESVEVRSNIVKLLIILFVFGLGCGFVGLYVLTIIANNKLREWS